MARKRSEPAELYIYSEKIPGARGNYGWPVKFDRDTARFVGVTQFDEHGAVTERVLLSPGQMKALRAFLRRPMPRFIR